MLTTAIVAARDRARLQEIAGVVVRHGLGGIMARLGLGALVRVPRGGGEDVAALSEPERLRRAIEALGPTFVKLGQILATRADLLPPEWIAELERLQTQAAPLPWQDIAVTVAEDIGGPPDGIFAAFDRTPLASASIAQIHRARLRDGREVVVKVRRPGLRRVIEADLRLLAHAAALAEAEWPGLARYRPGEMLDHLAAALDEELDLTAEGRNGEAVAANLADLPHVVIPAVHWDWTTERVLVQDFVAGLHPGDGAALAAAGLDRPLLARRGAEAFLRMVLVDGLFHADPHGGNLMALPDDRIAFLDFGMVGRLSDRRRDQIVTLVGAIVRGDAASLAGLMMDWSSGEGLDMDRLASGAEGYIARHGGARLDLGRAITDFMALSRANDVALPPDLALLFKALVTADGVMRRLDPEFDAVAAAAPLVRRALRRRYGPEALKRKAGTMALDLHGLAGELPGLMRLVSHRLKRGRLEATVEIKGLDRLGARIERAATRLALAVVVAAFALGLAPHLLAAGPQVQGAPLFAVAGLAVTLAGLAWLAVTAMRR